MALLSSKFLCNHRKTWLTKAECFLTMNDNGAYWNKWPVILVKKDSGQDVHTVHRRLTVPETVAAATDALRLKEMSERCEPGERCIA